MLWQAPSVSGCFAKQGRLLAVIMSLSWLPLLIGSSDADDYAILGLLDAVQTLELIQPVAEIPVYQTVQ